MHSLATAPARPGDVGRNSDEPTDLAVVGDTFWAQALVAPRALPGPVTLSTSGVTADSWNLAAVEILAAT